MIPLRRAAERQVDALLRHYAKKGRAEAGRNLIAAIDEAASVIERNSMAGVPAPRPYPVLARRGRAWIKVGRYWIAHTTNKPIVIVAVFYDQADIPGRN